MHSYFKNHTLAAGALLLTLTGIASRILGFFYRIFLSRTIGAEGLGVYQMVFPIYGICFSICAGSIQTAISRFTAADRDRAGRTLFAGFIISFSLALGLAAVIIRFSGFLASQVLMEPRCAPLLPAMALAIPCTSVHACLCGWYYGKEKVQVPALSQMVEQCIRIFTVFLIARIWEERLWPVWWPERPAPPFLRCCPFCSLEAGKKTGHPFPDAPPPLLSSQPQPRSWPWPCPSWETGWS